MIGRFLLGAGLGGLVGTGLLALISVNTPRSGMPLADEIAGEAAGEAAAPEASPPETAVTPAEAADQAEGAGAGTDSDLPAAPETEPPASPETPAMPEAAPEGSEADAPAAVEPQTPAAPSAPETEAAEAAPDGSAADAPAAVGPEAPASSAPATDGPDTVSPPEGAMTEGGPDSPAAEGVAPEAAASEPAAPLGDGAEAEGGPEARLVPADPGADAEAGGDVAPEAGSAPAAILSPPVEGAVGDEAPDAGLAATAPAAPDLPVTPAAPAAAGAESLPVAPETPAAAPEGLAGEEPVAPEAPDPVEAAGAAPDLETSPAAPQDPAALAVTVPEVAPADVDPPGPPPLTPEEEAMLAAIAEGAPVPPPGEGLAEASPAMPAEDFVVLPDPLPDPLPMPSPQPAPADPVAPPPGTADPILPEVISPGSTPAEAGDAGKRIVVGGGDLPAVPSLEERGAAAPDEAAPAPEADAPDAEPDDRPLVRNAEPFENPSAKPIFAVILIDSGDAALDRQALADLPFPVSFAVDPLAPGAAERAQIYRAAGQEVLMLATGLPAGASASDVEVAFQVMLQSLPQAVAVLDLPDPAFQADRPTASLVVPVVGAEGLGLVTWDQGLNAADQVARREGVPATVAFRALDAGEEAAPVIRRYLDRAAFKAAQEGRVTVIGTTRPETVAALVEWAVEGRAATVALAPVTAVLRTE